MKCYINKSDVIGLLNFAVFSLLSCLWFILLLRGKRIHSEQCGRRLGVH